MKNKHKINNKIIKASKWASFRQVFMKDSLGPSQPLQWNESLARALHEGGESEQLGEHIMIFVTAEASECGLRSLAVAKMEHVCPCRRSMQRISLCTDVSD